MNNEKLMTVGSKIRHAMERHNDGDFEERYMAIEMLCIATLDSEHCDFKPDILCSYLAGILLGYCIGQEQELPMPEEHGST